MGKRGPESGGMWVRGHLAGGAFRLGDRALVSEGQDFDLQ
jgi:hypothetical protein